VQENRYCRNIRIINFFTEFYQKTSPSVLALIQTDRTHAYSTLTEVFLTLTEGFLTLTEVFLCFFLGCKANARVKLAKMGQVPHSSKLVVICVVLLLLCCYVVICVVLCIV